MEVDADFVLDKAQVKQRNQLRLEKEKTAGNN